MPLAPLPYATSRSILVQAPPERIFTELVDFRRWRDWSPWEALDPRMHRSYSGPKSGVGSEYAWDGSTKAGAGSMRITGAQAPRSVQIDLHFEKPFPTDNDIRFDLVPQPEQDRTLVTWSMSGRHTGVMRVLGRVMSMDRLVGKDFERGLARLKDLAER
ncbi:SRPBCC family protein [Serinicoccus chungangensis]|uniref:SRPBCC family protein n=1 Tax=Serinicoccus chungangensis TaxID=767452 RepID=UPI001119009E|nr:SRPBCC family protein [Serinicoccus chungangensis]